MICHLRLAAILDLAQPKTQAEAGTGTQAANDRMPGVAEIEIVVNRDRIDFHLETREGIQAVGQLHAAEKPKRADQGFRGAFRRRGELAGVASGAWREPGDVRTQAKPDPPPSPLPVAALDQVGAIEAQ